LEVEVLLVIVDPLVGIALVKADPVDLEKCAELTHGSGQATSALATPYIALSMVERHQLTLTGPFSLGAAAGLRFGPDEGQPLPAAHGAAASMRLAFAVDGGEGYAGAVIHQGARDAPLEVDLELRDGAGAEAALRQIRRILSLDHDGDQFEAVGRSDPILGALQHAHPGQRPVLFCSPYEAAAWAIISARRPAAQAARVREALGRQLGESFELGGSPQIAFPAPRHLLGLGDQFPGLSFQKLGRLRDVAGSALDGQLDVPVSTSSGPTVPG
jgi:DNA-3-methyladenine glycosylase II